MQYYFAPMEGLTDSVFRRVHDRYFKGVHRYYTPFLSPANHCQLTPRMQQELPAADAVSFQTVPQLLTKNPEDFLWLTEICADLGYKEVNLNLGCPSGTVTAKGKGAGMLRSTETLDAFLEEIFQNSPVNISVKTRIGFEDPAEFPAILEVLNRYPICQLTVHPRVRKAFYSGKPCMDTFSYATVHSKNPLCYNGNLCSKEDIAIFHSNYPTVDAVMLGRGLIADPGMLSPGGTRRETLQEFCNALLEEYIVCYGGARNAMFRLKENWSYLICKFDNNEKLGKKLRKTTDLQQYRDITKEIFETLPMRDAPIPLW